MTRAGLNGNFHPAFITGSEQFLRDLGVTYLGKGEWTLPRGASIEQQTDEDWLLTMPDNRVNGGASFYHIWTED